MPRSKSRNQQLKPHTTAARQVTPQPTSTHHQVIQQKFHQGPLPSADELALYEESLPGSASRIIAMAEAQASHRQAIELNSLQADALARDVQIQIEGSRVRGIILNERIGLICGWLVASACIGGAITATVYGSGLATVALYLGLPVAGMVKAFLPARHNEK